MVYVFEDSLALKKRLPGTYPFCFLTYFRQQAMVFSSEDKAIIKTIMKKKAGKPIEYVKGTSQKNGY